MVLAKGDERVHTTLRTYRKLEGAIYLSCSNAPFTRDPDKDPKPTMGKRRLPESNLFDGSEIARFGMAIATCIHYPLRRLLPPQRLSVLYHQVSGHVGGRGSATPGDQLANGWSREARRFSASRRGRTSHDISQAEENMTVIAIRTNIISRDRSQFGEKPRHLLCDKYKIPIATKDQSFARSKDGSSPSVGAGTSRDIWLSEIAGVSF